MAIAENVKYKAYSPTQLFGDNQVTNLLVKDAYISERSKYIDIAYYHVRDLYNKNLFQLDYISTEDIVADGLIKSLLGDKFKSFVKQLELKVSRS